jgi:ribonuclease BN (tRNA processing enzyme)
MKLIFLGTTGAVSRKERDNTSLLFQLGEENYLLIDTPGSLVQKLKKLNIDYFKVNHIFITHLHPDHIYGLPSFIHCRMFDTSSQIYIYAHPISIRFIKKLLKMFNLMRRDKFPQVKLVKVKEGSTIRLNDEIKITPFKVKHSRESLGIKIQIKDKRILFSSDTAYSEKLIQEAKGSDILIHDCFAPHRFFLKYPQLSQMHTSAALLAKIYKEANPKLLIPIHFSGELDFEIREIEEELRREGAENIYIPSDLNYINFD